tara:strand:- start:82 stop:531 length:450 start_codon:yes stop_codon:yes gene_type:complete
MVFSKKLSKYWSAWKGINQNQKLDLIRSAMVLTLVKLGLVMLPFNTFRNWFRKIAYASSPRTLSKKRVDEIVWSINVMANLLPISLLCLPRALAAKYLLRGQSNMKLEIGVELNPREQFEAHAWIEQDGEIIIGDWDSSISYQRLWSWE